jgi:hypothetical protein
VGEGDSSFTPVSVLYHKKGEYNMKKITLFIIITLLVATPCFAGSGSVAITLSGTAGAGGTPASGSYDPVTDVSYGTNCDLFDAAWATCNDTTNCYTRIDEGTRSPTAPSNDHVKLPDNQGYPGCLWSWRTNTVTGTISTARVYVYCAPQTDGEITISVSNNGTSWSATQVTAACNTSWQYKDFTGLTYADTYIYVKFEEVTSDKMPQIWAAYVTVNP